MTQSILQDKFDSIALKISYIGNSNIALIKFQVCLIICFQEANFILTPNFDVLMVIPKTWNGTNENGTEKSHFAKTKFF